VTGAIRVDGLREFTRNLKRLDSNLPKMVRIALNEAAGLVADDAARLVPRRSGRAARSLRARSTRTEARVTGGGPRAVYYPFLDFGGTVGRGKRAAVAVGRGRRRTADQAARGGSVKRPFYADGRYLYPTYYRHRDSGRFQAVLSTALVDVARQAGIGVD
jgi:hypothetical protein